MLKTRSVPAVELLLDPVCSILLCIFRCTSSVLPGLETIYEQHIVGALYIKIWSHKSVLHTLSSKIVMKNC